MIGLPLFLLTLFVPANSPGQIFRYFERNRPQFPCFESLLLSDAAGDPPLRCLILQNAAEESPQHSGDIQELGSSLSKVFPPHVTLLWRAASEPPECARWGYTVWESGTVWENDEQAIPLAPKPTLLSRLPGMKRNTPPSREIAWALSRGLPIDRVPAAGLRPRIPIIDYETVAQLDQRGLLIENTPRLYRFSL